MQPPDQDRPEQQNRRVPDPAAAMLRALTSAAGAPREFYGPRMRARVTGRDVRRAHGQAGGRRRDPIGKPRPKAQARPILAPAEPPPRQPNPEHAAKNAARAAARAARRADREAARRVARGMAEHEAPR